MNDLTGNYYFTKTRKGLVLMVEYTYEVFDTLPGMGIYYSKGYRKAEEKDIPYIKVNIQK